MATYPGISSGSISNASASFDTLIVQNLVLNQEFLSKVSVVGDFTAQSNSYLDGDVYMSGNVYISNANLNEFLNISETTFFSGPVLFQGNNYLIGNTYLQNYLYLGKEGSQYLYGSTSGPNQPGGLGINNTAPQATFDICGGIVQSLNVFTSAEQNRNTIAQNNTLKGIVVNTTDTSSNILFFNDSAIISNTNADAYASQKGDAAISYLQGNTLQITNNQNQIFIRPDVTSFSKRGYRPDISGITTLIYDISYGSYKNNIYGSATSTTGKALWLVANDNSSNTFAIIGAPNNIGAAIGGGSYPLDSTRSMNTIGLSDISGAYISAMNIISGKDPLKYDTTIGINTFQPRTEKYVLDINGPIHIDNGDIRQINTYTNSLNGINSDTNGYSYIYGVQTSNKNIISIYNSITNLWSYLNISNNNSSEYINTSKVIYINDLYAIDCSHIFVGMSTNSEIRYTIDGITINIKNLKDVILTMDSLSPINKIYVNQKTSSLYNFYVCDSNRLYYLTADTYNNNNNFTLNKTTTFSQNINSISGINNGVNNTIFIATQTDISINIFDTSNNIITGKTMNWGSAGKPVVVSYNSIYAINTYTAVAVGSNIISYTNDGLNWSYINPNANLKSVYLYDASSAVAYDSSNNIWMTQYGLGNWTIIPPNYLNPSGKSNILYTNNNFIGLSSPNPNTLLFTANDKTTNLGKVVTCFTPNLFNRKQNHILDMSGNMRISGDMIINDRGEIISNNDSFQIIDRGVKNIYLGGDATKLVIGNAFMGNTYIRHNVDISLNTTIHGITYMTNGTETTKTTDGTLIVTGGAGISGNTFIGGNLNVQKGIESTSTGTGTVIVTGGVGISGNTFIGGNLNVKGNIESTSTGTGTVIVTGGVGISGNTFIGGNLNVKGNIESTSTGTGTVIVTGGVGISGNTFIGGNLNVKGNIESTSTGTGTVIVTGGVGISGNTFIGGNLNVKGNIESTSTGTGTVIVTGGVGISGNTFIGGNLNVKGNIESTSTETGTVIVTGGVGISGNTFIGGNLNVKQGIESTSTGTGTVIVTGGVGISGNTFIGGNLNVKGNIESTSTGTGTVIVTGGVGISGNTFIGGNLNVKGNIESTSTGTGTVIVTGGVGISGNTFIGGNLNVKQGIESTSTGTGTVIVTGGVGISGNTFIGGNLNVKQGIESTSTGTGTVIVTGGVGISGNTFIGGNLNVKGNIESNSTGTGTVIVTGGVGISGNTFIGGNLNVKGNIESTSTGTGTVIVTGGVGISGNTFIGGNLNITKGTESTSTKTGTVIVTGGVGISGNTFIGGNLNVQGNIESTNTTSGTVIVTGGVGISGNTFIGRNTYIGGSVSIGKTSNSGYGLDVLGTTNLSSSVFAANYLDIESNYLTTLATPVIISGIDFVPKNLNPPSSTVFNFEKTNVTVNSDYQNGNYYMKSSATGIKGFQNSINVFNGDSNNYYYTSDDKYNSGTNTTISTTYNGSSTVSGDWIEVDISNNYIYALNSISILCQTPSGTFTIYALGSNDTASNSSKTWYQINNGNTTITIANGNTTYNFNIGSTSYYKCFRFVFNTIPSGNTGYALKNFKLSGSAKLITPIYPNLNITTTTNITGNLFLTNDASFNSNLVVGSSLDSTSVGTGALIISGGTSIGGNTFIGGNLNVKKGTESTSTSTGTLIVTGGMGITGNIFMGGNLTINSLSDSSFNSSPAPAALNISGGVNISKNVNIGQKLYTNNIQPIGNNSIIDIGKYDNAIGQYVTAINIANNASTQTNTKITIGGQYDTVTIGGTLVINGTEINNGAVVDNTPFLLINNGMPTASTPIIDASGVKQTSRGNGTSAGAGFFIADNQDLSSNQGDKTVATAWSYIKISQDTNSFIIKPTGYNSATNSYSNSNRIRLGENLSNVDAKNSLVILQSSSHASTPAGGNAQNPNEYDYRIISSQFDLSSILQRDITNSTFTSQRINTDFIIGDQSSSYKKSMAIGTSVNGNTYSLNMIGNIYQNTASTSNGFIIQF